MTNFNINMIEKEMYMVLSDQMLFNFLYKFASSPYWMNTERFCNSSKVLKCIIKSVDIGSMAAFTMRVEIPVNDMDYEQIFLNVKLEKEDRLMFFETLDDAILYKELAK